MLFIFFSKNINCRERERERELFPGLASSVIDSPENSSNHQLKV